MNPRKWIREYYIEEEDPHFPPHCITCKMCPSATCFKGENRVTEFINHLRFKHNITELNNHPQANILNEKYNIDKNSASGRCKKCDKIIHLNEGLWRLENHLRICQPDDSLYTKMDMLLLKECILWNKYIVKNNKKMRCSKCEYEEEDVVSRPEEKLPVLLSHWDSHWSRYVKKYFLYLLKRAKIKLVLFVCFNIFL